MPLTPAIKQRIDKMTYEEMLRKWRTAPVGDPMFTGETGVYFSQRFAELKAATEDAKQVAASKLVGWIERE